MEKAKKMFLIDPESISRLQQSFTRSLNSNTLTLSNLDQEMNLILNSPTLPDREKWTKYNQVLQRYLHFVDESRKPVAMNITEREVPSSSEPELPDKTAEDVKAIDFMREQTLAAIPKVYRNNAALLYDKLSFADSVKWDRLGTVSINGRKITGSSITDLIADSVRNRRVSNPEGWMDFATVLTDLNVPLELIGNTRRKEFIRIKHHQPSTRGSTQSFLDSLKTPLVSASPPRKRQKIARWDQFTF